MRKEIKIKASVILLSWLVLFAHGLIPHSHNDDIAFHHEFHSKGCIAGVVNISTHNCETKSECRISNLLFNKFSQDDQHFVLNSGCAAYHILTSWPVIYNNHYSFLTGRYSDTESLRAPPCA